MAMEDFGVYCGYLFCDMYLLCGAEWFWNVGAWR